MSCDLYLKYIYLHDRRVCPTLPHAVHFDGAFFCFCIGSSLLFCSNWSHFRFLGFGKGIRGSRSGRYSDSLWQRPVRQNGWISVIRIALLLSNKLEIRCAQGSPIVLVNTFVQGDKGAISVALLAFVTCSLIRRIEYCEVLVTILV